jgi:hypothetical protein
MNDFTDLVRYTSLIDDKKRKILTSKYRVKSFIKEPINVTRF